MQGTKKLFILFKYTFAQFYFDKISGITTIKFSVLYTSFIIFFISCHQPDTVFTSVSPSSTNIYFTNKLEKHKAFGILYYLYYYNGGGVATGDINNDGLPDIYFTANSKGGNKLYLNKGNFQFDDITEKSRRSK
jgi:hypothetical protein